MYDMKIRKRIYQIIEISDKKDKPGLIFDFVLYFSIVINILFFWVGSFYKNEKNSFFIEVYSAVYITSVFIYAIELFLRIWTCVENKTNQSPLIKRLKFILNPLIIIDITVVASFFLFGPLVNIIFMRSIRLFNLSQYIGETNDYSPYLLLRKSILNKKEELLITFFGSLITLIICSYLIYFIERNAQPGALNSISPSMKWAFGVLTNSGTEGFRPITMAGKTLHIIMTVIGVLVIGLPLGIITGGFISEIEDAKKNITLRKNAGIIIKAFAREPKIKIRNHATSLQLPSEARWIDMDHMSAKIQFAPNEIFEIVRSSNQLRIRACKQTKESVFEDNLIVEYFPSNEKFGVKTLRNSHIHILATQNYSDHGIGHYSRILAETTKANYYSNEFFSSGDMLPEKRINFSGNADYLSEKPSKDDVFEDWKRVLFENIKKDDTAIYIGTAGSHNYGDFQLLCGGPKGDYDFTEIADPTFGNIEAVSKFYLQLKDKFKPLNISIVKQNNFPNTDEKHCSRAIRKKTEANVVTLYVNTNFLQFADPTLYYDSIRILADEITNTLHK
jgi:voltage-gated potassium channel